jgi:predicted transposase YbfD/YdcC
LFLREEGGSTDRGAILNPTIDAFLDHFGELEDTREADKVLHPVREILLVTLCGVLAGAEGWEDIEDYGASKLPLLREMLPFIHGIPSDDTLRRFFRAIHPAAFQEVFVSFVRTLLPAAADRLIAIDGKTSRRSHDGAVKALHVVSAFAMQARLVLAQAATAEKSNEITAIPELLRLLDLRGATVSIENTLHWTLDMSFGEDACRIRKDNAPLAIATIRHVAFNLLQAAKQKRESIKRLRKKAGWDNYTLKRILKFS